MNLNYHFPYEECSR